MYGDRKAPPDSEVWFGRMEDPEPGEVMFCTARDINAPGDFQITNIDQDGASGEERELNQNIVNTLYNPSSIESRADSTDLQEKIKESKLAIERAQSQVESDISAGMVAAGLLSATTGRLHYGVDQTPPVSRQASPLTTSHSEYYDELPANILADEAPDYPPPPPTPFSQDDQMVELQDIFLAPLLAPLLQPRPGPGPP